MPMNDHVERMVQSWFERTEFECDKQRAQMHDLINGIHRMLREAENDTRALCEEIAVQTAGEDEIGGRIALAIRTSSPESLPRKSLIEVHAPELMRQ
jgi:hypothetical protein